MGQADCQNLRRVPRGAQRRKEIAAVAEHTFLELGYAETTMQIIASRAGASKETLYRHFGSKEALLAEIMQARAEQITGHESGYFQLDGEPEKVLFEIAYVLLGYLTHNANLSLFRMVLVESQRTPELAKIFLEQGPKRILNQLSGYLKAETDRGRLRCTDPDLAAKMFLGAVTAFDHICTLLSVGNEPLTDAGIRAQAKEAVSMFLAYYSVKTAKTAG
jgi:AcrR family transcriptional regulator